jgi:glycosyltransferase involved in cell wall biosynthesis
MRILFAHKNFPAQFGAFGEWLAGEGWEVAFLTQRAGAASPAMRVVVSPADHRAPAEGVHRYVRPLEGAVITGQAFARAAVELDRAGFRPDIVMFHAGWGVGTFLADVWPGTCAVPYFEWYYNWPYPDRTPYDAPAADPLEARARNRIRNAALWADFSTATRALCPTRFQAAQFPPWMRAGLTVMHDGVDTDLHAPGAPGAERNILARWGIPADAEVLTSITRGMEPHRGFPETMRAIALLQKRRPKLHALIGGEDRVAYGAQLPQGESWKQRLLAELGPGMDLSRLHFTGLMSRPDMVAVMRASDVHVYLTVPFVLSWSLLDAMACGCLLVANDTAPVREFVEDGVTGLLVPPGAAGGAGEDGSGGAADPEALAARIGSALDAGRAGTAMARIRERARARTVETLDARRVIWPRKRAWLEAAVAPRAAAGRRGRRGREAPGARPPGGIVRP